MILGWALLLNSPKWFEWTTTVVEESSSPLEQGSENFTQESEEQKASERSEASLMENNTLNLEDKIKSTFDMTSSPGKEVDETGSAREVLFKDSLFIKVNIFLFCIRPLYFNRLLCGITLIMLLAS